MSSLTLCNKYKAECFSDIVGQEAAIGKIKIFLKNFPGKKALILHGKTGTGKTSLAYSLAQETNSEILELNASDLRNKEEIEKIIGHASKQQSLFKKGKILLIDEIDGITKDDRGGLQALNSIIDNSNFPAIITANDIWDKKFSELRRKAELVETKELHYQDIYKILKEISEKENLNLNEDILKILAIKARGDVRAAINDLQTINEETREIDERDKEENIFNVLKQIFQALPHNSHIQLYDKLSIPLDQVLLWLEENAPLEYKGEELYKAFDALSKADVFRGRIHRQQHWRFLVYQNFFLSYGVSSAKKQGKMGFVKYRRPERILKIWLINQKKQKIKSIAEKYALCCHISIKRAMKEFPLIRQILKNEKIRKELKLDEEEVEFLNLGNF